MANLFAPYSLCPLIERSNFLGVSEDPQCGCVIVTLGRNTAVRYRLSDQKQLSYWSTRNKLTAPVVYDYFNRRFIGVFNSEELAFWQDSLEQLNKLKKHKFIWLIFGILSSKEVPPHVVFMNGIVSPLSIERDVRKRTSAADYISTSENIKDAQLIRINGKHCAAIYTISAEGEHKLYFDSLSEGEKKISLTLHRGDDYKLTGHAITELDEKTFLVTLWSDGEMYSVPIPDQADSFPGRLVAQLNCIDPRQPAALLPVSGHQVAIYGASPHSKDGVLCIFSVKYGVAESSVKLKMYTEARPALSSREILLPCGSSLLVVPFKLDSPKFLALLGIERDPSLSQKTAQQLAQEGYVDPIICEVEVGRLIEAADSRGLIELLTTHQDLPDSCLFNVLEFTLDQPSSKGRDKLINAILSRQLCNDDCTVALVRKHVNLSSALYLLQILADKMSEGFGDKSPIEWSCLLLDAHYQEYLLSRDPQVIETIRKVQDTVKKYMENIEVMKQLDWELMALKLQKPGIKKTSSHSYVIETIKLY